MRAQRRFSEAQLALAPDPDIIDSLVWAEEYVDQLSQALDETLFDVQGNDGNDGDDGEDGEPMRICCYTNLHPVTEVTGNAHGFTFVHMEDNEHYWRTMKGAWALGQTFTILEHDMLCWGIDELESCPSMWCVRPYWYGPEGEDKRWLSTSLGLTKFSGSLTRACKGIMDHPKYFDEDGRNWGGIEGRLNSALIPRFGPPHVHQPTMHMRGLEYPL